MSCPLHVFCSLRDGIALVVGVIDIKDNEVESAGDFDVSGKRWRSWAQAG